MNTEIEDRVQELQQALLVTTTRANTLLADKIGLQRLLETERAKVAKLVDALIPFSQRVWTSGDYALLGDALAFARGDKP